MAFRASWMAICIMASAREANNGCPSEAPPAASKAVLLHSSIIWLDSLSFTCPLSCHQSGRNSFLHDKVMMETITVKTIKILVIRFIKKEIGWLKNKNALGAKV